MPDEFGQFEGQEFEWDADKAIQVERDHNIRFIDTLSVFIDPLSVEVYDEANSQDEDRFVRIGHAAGTIVVVVNTPRGSRIRLITARRATPSERRSYEQDEAS